MGMLFLILYWLHIAIFAELTYILSRLSSMDWQLHLVSSSAEGKLCLDAFVSLQGHYRCLNMNGEQVHTAVH